MSKIVDRAEIYEQLREVANTNCNKITNNIIDKILSLHSGLNNSINVYHLKHIIFEIVKNCIDSVNVAKSANPSIEAIEIKLVTESDNSKLKIKIKDNGGGVTTYDKSKKVSMDKFISSKQSKFPFNFPLTVGSKKLKNPGSKSVEKQHGKVYLLGGLGIGLKDANEIIKTAKGEMSIKNRKAEGVTIEITLPYSEDENTKSKTSTTVSNTSALTQVSTTTTKSPQSQKNLSPEKRENEKTTTITANETPMTPEEIVEEIEESEYLLNPKSLSKNRNYGT